MFVYSDLFAHVRYALSERRYAQPQVVPSDLYNLMGFNEWESGGYNATDYGKYLLLSPELQARYAELAQAFLNPEFDHLRSLDFRDWYITWEGSTPEEFMATARIVSTRDECRQHATSTGAPSRLVRPDRFGDFIRDYLGEYYTVDVFPDYVYTATLDPDLLPASLRRFVTSDDLVKTGVGATTRTVSGGATLVDGKLERYDGDGLAMAWNYMPLASASLIKELTNRRDDHRENLRQRLPGYVNRVAIQTAENRAQRERRSAALQRYNDWRGGVPRINDANLIASLPFVPNGIRASLRWGIEIETGAGRDLSGTPAQWESKDDGSLESAYGESWIDPEDCPEYADSHLEPTMSVWHGDNTIDVPNPDFEDPRYCNYCGENGSSYDSDDCVELVSPILSSMHSRGLKQICEDLEFAPRTDSAGIHVHVEAKELTVRQIGQLVLSYDKIEHLIEASYDRVERGYCKRRSADEVLEIARNARTARSVDDMRKGDRYVTVNLQALEAHGTIEFRAMGPRYNYDHLVRWAMFCREMVNCAKNGATSKEWGKVKDWDGVLGMFAKYGEEYNMALDHELAKFDEAAELAAV